MSAHPDPSATQPAGTRGPFRLAFGMVAVVFVLIAMGAMVTSTTSGMAFPDWPLSDGEWMPERAFTEAPAFLEHFHRVIGAIAGLMVLALAIWLQLGRLGAPGVRKAAWWGGVLILTQGVIGGVGVRLNTPVATSAAHGTLAQITIATFAVIAYALSDRWRATTPIEHPGAGGARKLTAIGLVALVVQTLIGAVARHGNVESMLWTHVANAFVVFLLLLAAIGFASGRFASVPGVKGLSHLLLAMLVAQIVLGFVALMVRTGKHPENIHYPVRAALISTHVLVGATLTLLTALLAAHVRRGTLPPRA